jgi:hypothetical protein
MLVNNLLVNSSAAGTSLLVFILVAFFCLRDCRKWLRCRWRLGWRLMSPKIRQAMRTSWARPQRLLRCDRGVIHDDDSIFDLES